jgi:O-antigen/teichoic acid export membrane protein
MSATQEPLRKSIAWTAVGNAVYLGSQYGILMALAKLGTATLVGEFSLSLAILTPFFVLSQMQLRQVLVTESQNETSFGAFFWIRALAGFFALLVSVSVVLLLGYEADLLLAAALLGAAKFAESQSDIVHAALQRRERMDLVSSSMITRGLLSVVAVTATLLGGGSLVAASAALAMTCAFTLFVVDLRLLRANAPGHRIRWRWDRSAVRRLIGASAPLTLASGVLSFSASLPRYFLEHFNGPEAVAVFAVAMAPISLMGLFAGALSQATLARASVYLQGGRLLSFRSLGMRLTILNVLLGVALVGALVAAGRPAVRLFFTPQYEPAASLMILLGVGVAMSGIGAFGSTVLAAGRRFRLQLLTAVVGLLIQLPACALLVPSMGLWGAAWAEFARFVGSGVFLQAVGWLVFRDVRSPQLSSA